MPKRMLIDASHPEETRVIVLDGQKVEEFDFEAASKRPLKGNIYLAKVTRVEPSLQAAFVEYGGNRQGFLAFSEIHPDYYQIPVADRLALLAEQEAEARRRSEDEFESIETATAPAQSTSVAAAAQSDGAYAPEGLLDTEFELSEGRQSESVGSSSDPQDAAVDLAPGEGDVGTGDGSPAEPGSTLSAAPVEEVLGSEIGPNVEAVIEAPAAPAQAKSLQTARPPQRWMRRRHYKIQEVVKRRQIILVQVVKEERGTKGAALTTYLSLAGRYCVLMPNTPRGGGISRKITSAADRKRLKTAAQSLELPEGMGLIIRTAGENRTKTEIKRDYEYLLRMWDTVRELTLKSNAPACVYEEGDLIKRAIRDLYNKDVSEIVVEGEEGYRNAKDFMRMLMPSHAKNVKFYKEPVPLFQRHHIEAQLDAMFSSTVTLRSGGYVVINQTEALVAIDVNSGRATREHSIEDTAYKTNLEAAEEIARQLRLRDLAGLIVIDFIDMEDNRNDRNVEKRLRDCVKNDRARVQIGKISQFGLLEMSRQRLRAGVVAGSTITCPHCGGQGIVRSVESTALRVLRSLEEEGQRQRAAAVIVRAQPDVTIYTLNQKRRELTRIETDYGLAIQFEPKEGIIAGTFEIDRITQKAPEERLKTVSPQALAALEAPAPQEDSVEEETDDETENEGPPPSQQESPSGQPQPAGGKRRRRRRRRGREHSSQPSTIAEPLPTYVLAGTALDSEERNDLPDTHALPDAPIAASASAQGSSAPGSPTDGGAARRRRRRRRRGRRGAGESATTPNEGALDHHSEVADIRTHPERMPPPADPEPEIPAPSRAIPNAPSEPVWSLASEQSGLSRQERPDQGEFGKPGSLGGNDDTPAQEARPVEKEIATAEEVHSVDEAPRPARRGWWQRPFRSRE